jgi:aminoglycoside phosphotransferase (APT) family kinase protein
MSRRHEQNTGTRDVRDAHRFDEQQLLDYLSSHVESFQGPLTVRQFKGGQSNPTYLLDAGSGRYVLRRKPPGKLLKSAHAVDREFRVISALYAAGFPVPRPVVLCKDDEVIGTMFFVMEFVEGRIFWDLDLPGLDGDERTAIYDNVNQTIADLHNYDYGAIGLEDYGKPGNYFARQISRWSGQYRASETATVEAMDSLIRWLPQNIPHDDSASIVHGDFRLDNMILHRRS